MLVKNNKTIHNCQPNELTPGNLPEEINQQSKIAALEDMLTVALCTV